MQFLKRRLLRCFYFEIYKCFVWKNEDFALRLMGRHIERSIAGAGRVKSSFEQKMLIFRTA